MSAPRWAKRGGSGDDVGKISKLAACSRIPSPPQAHHRATALERLLAQYGAIPLDDRHLAQRLKILCQIADWLRGARP